MSTAPAVAAQLRSQRKQSAATSEAERDRKRSAPLSSSRETSRPSSRTSTISHDTSQRKLGTLSSHSGYTNQAYQGSVRSVPNAVHRGGNVVFVNVPNNEVVLEQYCSCTRWSRLERMLVVTVAVLVGMVVGLVVVVIALVIADPDLDLEGLFRRSPLPAAV